MGKTFNLLDQGFVMGINMHTRTLRDTALPIFLALWMALTPAFAGSMMLLGVGGGASGALPGPPTFAFQGGATGTVTATTYTVATGTASPNRFVVVLVSIFSCGCATITSAVFDGTISGTVTSIANASGSTIAVITAPIPLNTSSTLVIGQTNAGTGRIASYTTDITTLSSTTPTVFHNTVASATANTTSGISVANSGSALIVSDVGSGNGTKSYTAGTPTITQDNTFNVSLIGHAFSLGAGTYSVATTWTTAGNDNMGVAIFR